MTAAAGGASTSPLPPFRPGSSSIGGAAVAGAAPIGGAAIGRAAIGGAAIGGAAIGGAAIGGAAAHAHRAGGVGSLEPSPRAGDRDHADALWSAMNQDVAAFELDAADPTLWFVVDWR